jgi:hypothetical protein
MLRACALQYGRSWDKSLLYAEFYNNSYQESLKMAPFEMLYGRRCRTPLFWSETRERKVFGPNILQEAEKQVRMVRENHFGQKPLSPSSTVGARGAAIYSPRRPLPQLTAFLCSPTQVIAGHRTRAPAEASHRSHTRSRRAHVAAFLLG